MEDGDDVLGMDRVDAPLGLSLGQPEHAVGEGEHHPQLVPLPLLRLGDLGHGELLSSQLLQQLLQNLTTREQSALATNTQLLPAVN